MAQKISNPWRIRLGFMFVLCILAQPPAFCDTTVVRSVLFYSPTCPHCQDVIEEVLKPLLREYREQLLIVSINVREADGQALYRNARQRFSIPDERRGVPTLIAGDQVMVGSAEIPGRFPALVEQWLEEGGIALPDIPGLAERLKDMPDAVGHAPSHDTDVSLTQKMARDPIGNGLAVLMLAVMLIVVIQSLLRFSAYRKAPGASARPGWPAALVAVIGLVIAGYMAYVETANVLAVCGPVGDCNTVQQSDYAKLFGIPLGVLGIGGYVLILVAWLLSRFAAPALAAMGMLGLFGMALGGTLFSIYLTFLEPFVIGATCAWCLGSALCMTLLLLLTRKPAAASWPYKEARI